MASVLHAQPPPAPGPCRCGRRDNSQNVVEYGILIATIAIIVLIGVTRFGSLIEPWFAALAGRITTVDT